VLDLTWCLVDSAAFISSACRNKAAPLTCR
jgi:hypothetical protein